MTENTSKKKINNIKNAKKKKKKHKVQDYADKELNYANKSS